MSSTIYCADRQNKEQLGDAAKNAELPSDVGALTALVGINN
ncbi:MULTISPECIES: hypothetical protein [Burkholderia]|nr:MULTISPECIES: hypothetical protein [Burkholderia]